MSKVFKFNPNNHNYTLDGKKLTGVTTIIGIIDKSGPLMHWAVNETIDFLTKNPGQYDEAKNAWRTKRDKAGDIGSLVHKMIEIFAKGQMNGNRIELNEILSRSMIEVQEDGGSVDGVDLEQASKMYLKFTEWVEEEGVKILLSEQQVYSADYWYAGTFDLVFEKDGKKYLGDVKTAKDIYSTNYVQMAGYDICLDEHDKIKDLHGYCVINIPKILKKNGDASLKVKYVYNTDELKDAFLAALTLYRFINNN